MTSVRRFQRRPELAFPPPRINVKRAASAEIVEGTDLIEPLSLENA